MSKGLLAQLSEYGSQHDAQQGALDPLEIMEHAENRAFVYAASDTGSRSTRRGWWVAATTALVVLVAGVVVVSLRARSHLTPTAGAPVPARYVLTAPEFQTGMRTDFVDALPGDDGLHPMSLDLARGLPNSHYLDFLFAPCRGCDRDPSFVDPVRPRAGSGAWIAGEPFHVRHGFTVDGETPLGSGFSLSLFVTRWDWEEGDAPPGSFLPGQTYRFTPDYVTRGSSDLCGPTSETQDEAVTCEVFVHDFPDGLPAGRFELVAAWEAPCSAWLNMGLVATCGDPSEVISIFSVAVDSGVEAGRYEDLDFGHVNGATAPLPAEATVDVAEVGVVTDIFDTGGDGGAFVVDGSVLVPDSTGALTTIDLATMAIRTRVGFGDGFGDSIVTGGGDIWASTDRSLLRIDPTSLIVTDTIQLAGVRDLFVDQGAIWARHDRGLTRIDMGSASVTHEYDFPADFDPWWSARSDHSIWLGAPTGMMGSDGADLLTFDLETREFSARSQSECCGYHLSRSVIVDGIAWLVGDDSIERVDLGSGVTDTLLVGTSNGDAAFGHGALWVPDRAGGAIARIDVGSAQVTDTVDVGVSPGAPVFAGGDIWVPDRADGSVWRIDPVTRRTIGRVVLGGLVEELVVTDGAVWVVGAGTLTRIEMY